MNKIFILLFTISIISIKTSAQNTIREIIIDTNNSECYKAYVFNEAMSDTLIAI